MHGGFIHAFATTADLFAENPGVTVIITDNFDNGTVHQVKSVFENPEDLVRDEGKIMTLALTLDPESRDLTLPGRNGFTKIDIYFEGEIYPVRLTGEL